MGGESLPTLGDKLKNPLGPIIGALILIALSGLLVGGLLMAMIILFGGLA